MYLQYRDYNGALQQGLIVTQTTYEGVVWVCGQDKSHRLVLVRWVETDWDGNFWKEVSKGNWTCAEIVRESFGKKRHSRVIRFLLAQGITLSKPQIYVETAADKRRRLIDHKTYSLNRRLWVRRVRHRDGR
jgi:hypothetical protein